MKVGSVGSGKIDIVNMHIYIYICLSMYVVILLDWFIWKFAKGTRLQVTYVHRLVGIQEAVSGVLQLHQLCHSFPKDQRRRTIRCSSMHWAHAQSFARGVAEKF